MLGSTAISIEAQTGVKKMFADEDPKKELDAAGYQFSSANSINIGRLVPQIVYYVYAYSRLLANDKDRGGESINGCADRKFWKYLSRILCKKYGVADRKTDLCINENKVLFDFFRTGVYDKNREFILTNSPSMDILMLQQLGAPDLSHCR